MDLVNRNARLSFLQRFRASSPSAATISKEVEETLDLEKAPRRIECFDISNLQGSDVVASMVVWEDGRMKKSDYRRFIIRSLSGLPDDFQSMREVVTRWIEYCRSAAGEHREEGGEHLYRRPRR